MTPELPAPNRTVALVTTHDRNRRSRDIHGSSLEPLDLMARLAALVPPPRMHLTRYHGVFAPHSRLRAQITPAHRGVEASKALSLWEEPPQPATPPHVAMNWAPPSQLSLI